MELRPFSAQDNGSGSILKHLTTWYYSYANGDDIAILSSISFIC